MPAALDRVGPYPRRTRRDDLRSSTVGGGSEILQFCNSEIEKGRIAPALLFPTAACRATTCRTSSGARQGQASQRRADRPWPRRQEHFPPQRHERNQHRWSGVRSLQGQASSWRSSVVARGGMQEPVIPNALRGCNLSNTADICRPHASPTTSTSQSTQTPTLQGLVADQKPHGTAERSPEGLSERKKFRRHLRADPWPCP
jgi:hypothetical protein